MYRYYAEIVGANIIALRYTTEMQFPLSDVIAALKNKPRVLFIANPNNPTGTLVRTAEIETILQAATHTAVVIDEAYAEFSEVTVVPLIKKYAHLFVARTFSKAAGLAGLRLGAVIGGAESVAILKRGMPPFPVNLAVLVAAEAAIADKSTTRRYVWQVQRVRKWFEEQLAKLEVKTYPSSGNFLLADFGARGPELFRALERAGILVRERSKDLGPGFARITIGTPSEMERLTRVIRRFIREKN
jgi:histidinol-phosphate aminotransferase